MRSRGVFWALQLYRFLPPLGTIIFTELSGSLTLRMGCLHLTLIFQTVFTAFRVKFVFHILPVVGVSLPARNLQSSDRLVLVPLVIPAPGPETPHQKVRYL